MKLLKLSMTAILSASTIGCSQKLLLKKPSLDLDPKPVAMEKSTGEDKLAEDQWNLKSLNMDQVWQKYASSRAVNVMLVGTGIDYNHEDLRANVPVEEKEDKKFVVGRDFVDDDMMAYDNYGHDTYLAGVIGGVHDNGKGIKGVLKSVSLTPVRYINRNGVATLPQLQKALAHIAEAKPHVALVNLVRVPLSKFPAVRKIELDGLRQELKKVLAAKVPVVIGAGNSAELINERDELRAIFFEFENVFFVTSVDSAQKRPWIANYSAQFVQTTAPGVDVKVTVPGNGYKNVSGANIAAAHVAAALGYAQALHSGQKTFKEYFKALMSEAGSDVLPELQSIVVGSNTLNVAKFLQALE